MQQEFLEAVYHQHALVGKQRLNMLHNCTKNLKYFKQVNVKKEQNSTRAKLRKYMNRTKGYLSHLLSVSEISPDSRIE